MELILYGCGKRCEIILELLRDRDDIVYAVVDSNPEKWGNSVYGYQIASPDILSEMTDKYICVTFYSTLVNELVWSDLQNCGFDKNHILSFHDVLLKIYKEIVQINNYEQRLTGKKKYIFDGTWRMTLGGVESWLRIIVPALAKSGVDNIYLATEKVCSQINSENVIDFCLYDTPKFSMCYLNRCIKFILEQQPCTIVFSRVDELLLAAALLKEKRSSSIRIIMAVHGSCDGMYRDILSYKEYIDYYVCVSGGINNALIKCGIEPDKVEVMTCPVSFNTMVNRTYTTNDSSPIKIGYAGRLEIFEKRIDVLQDVILNLERRNVNYFFSIAGAGSQFESMKLFLKKNGLVKKVKLLGQLPHDRMGEFWLGQDIALNTSDNEGRPLSNMEAMVNGAVPIVTHTVGILDDVHDKINGYIVPINDGEQMAERICYLNNNRQLLQYLGEAARKEIIGKTDLNKHVNQWKRIFEKVEGLS